MQTEPVPIYTLSRHLPLRVKPSSTMTDDELFELCARNRGLRIERTSEGELIIMSPTGGESGRRNFALITQLGVWAQRDGTGVGFDSSTGFLLPNGAQRAPDAAWVRRERWEQLTPEQRRRFVPLCPDFVVELRSASDELPALMAKMEEYAACGARLGWLIDVDARCAWVYRPGRGAEALHDVDRLNGNPELAGFVLDVGALA